MEVTENILSILGPLPMLGVSVLAIIAGLMNMDRCRSAARLCLIGGLILVSTEIAQLAFYKVMLPKMEFENVQTLLPVVSFVFGLLFAASVLLFVLAAFSDRGAGDQYSEGPPPRRTRADGESAWD